MKIKYYSDDDYRKAKCNAVKLLNKIHSETYNIYQRNYKKKRNKIMYKEYYIILYCIRMSDPYK